VKLICTFRAAGGGGGWPALDASAVEIRHGQGPGQERTGRTEEGQGQERVGDKAKRM